jgi:signal transduction histidine kinase
MLVEGNSLSKATASNTMSCHQLGQQRRMPLAAQDAHPSEFKAKQQTIKGLTVASAAHELKNPIESITNLVYLLQRNFSLDREAREYVQLVDKELERVRYVINQTLAGFREPASSSLVSVPDVLDTILRFYSDKIVFKQIGIDKRYECDGVVKAHSEDLRQVFSNLIVNALEALRLKGKALGAYLSLPRLG